LDGSDLCLQVLDVLGVWGDVGRMSVHGDLARQTFLVHRESTVQFGYLEVREWRGTTLGLMLPLVALVGLMLVVLVVLVGLMLVVLVGLTLG
jgi:hypothetical protein